MDIQKVREPPGINVRQTSTSPGGQSYEGLAGRDRGQTVGIPKQMKDAMIHSIKKHEQGEPIASDSLGQGSTRDRRARTGRQPAPAPKGFSWTLPNFLRQFPFRTCGSRILGELVFSRRKAPRSYTSSSNHISRESLVYRDLMVLMLPLFSGILHIDK